MKTILSIHSLKSYQNVIKFGTRTQKISNSQSNSCINKFLKHYVIDTLYIYMLISVNTRNFLTFIYIVI